MKKIFICAALILAACQSPERPPQNFEDLLKITDTTDQPICTLPLADVRQSLSAEALETKQAEAFDYDALNAQYADDPAAQIRIILRRAALKRRLRVEGDDTAQAEKFYTGFEVQDILPTTLEGFNDAFQYWDARIGEQSDYGNEDSAAYNLRFCVMNEKRADLHAASRTDIMGRVERGGKLPSLELVETLSHEPPLGDAFSNKMLEQIFNEENASKLTPLTRTKIRKDVAIMPFDPKTADLFWTKRDEEIAVILDFIDTENFDTPADKLTYMTNIDQSLRKLWYPSEIENHFESAEEFEAFTKGVSERVIKVDEFNTAELEEMLEGRGWFRDDVDGAGAAGDAWLIAQHADLNPDFQEKALTMIEAELDAPGVSKSNYAYLYDRVQVQFGDGEDTPKKLQRYGTQGQCTGPGTWEPFPLETPERIDEIRAEVGLGSMAEYKSRFKNICKEDRR